MVLVEAIVLNDSFVLIFGTFTLLLATFLLITFAFLFQRKLIRKQQAFREIELLLQKQETKAAYAVLEAQELERKRIAEDLHDQLGSRLASVKLHFHAFKNGGQGSSEFFTRGDKLLDEAVEEVREISHNLLSGILSKFGLVAALEDLKETLGSTKQLNFQLQVHYIDQRFDLMIEVGLYRIIQELVSNILKHARATEVILQLTRHDKDILVIIEDNGVGFDQHQPNHSGIGLSNIYSRVEKLRGRISIDSQVDKGTIVTIEIPLTHDSHTISR